MKNFPRESSPDWCVQLLTWLLPCRFGLWLTVAVLLSVQSLRHEVRRDLWREGDHPRIKTAASHQLPLPWRLHRACDLQSHHGVTSAKCVHLNTTSIHREIAPWTASDRFFMVPYSVCVDLPVLGFFYIGQETHRFIFFYSIRHINSRRTFGPVAYKPE